MQETQEQKINSKRLLRSTGRYVIRFVTLLIAVSIISFTLVSMSPVDPVQQYVGAVPNVSMEQPAIGIILSESMRYISTGMWWLAFFSGLMLAIIVLLFDRLGENLKKIIDPYSAHV